MKYDTREGNLAYRLINKCAHEVQVAFYNLLFGASVCWGFISPDGGPFGYLSEGWHVKLVEHRASYYKYVETLPEDQAL